MRHLSLPLLLLSLAAHAQTDLMLPWVTNNAQFRGTIIVNNPSADMATIILTARRGNGESETATRQVAAFGQLVEGSDALFPNLGDGPGYAVELSSDRDNTTGAFVIRGTFSASGSSPAQANVVSPDSAAPIIMYSYLPVPPEGGDSAPVVVNLGTTTADVSFHGYQDGQEIGTFAVMVEPREPYANVTSAMFPGVTGDIYVVAESTQPVLGMAFIFNLETEPSMSNAVPFPFVPQPMTNMETVSFAADVQPIFTASCTGSGCHSGSSPAQGMLLTAGSAYANIVDVPALQSPLDRVEPMDAENSYLYRKVDPALSRLGQMMPLIGDPLSPSQLDTIATWINEGALDN